MSYWLTKKDNILKIVYSMKQESHIFPVNLITLKQQLVEIKNICQILSKTVQQAFLRPQWRKLEKYFGEDSHPVP